MIILGISPLDNEASVCLVINGKLVFAASEERYTRVKQQTGFPHKAMEDALKYANIEATDIDHVVYPFLQAQKEVLHLTRNVFIELFRAPFEPIPLKERILNIAVIVYRYLDYCFTQLRYYYELITNLKKLNLHHKLTTYHHHKSHAASAYFSSGFEPCLALIIDGYGTGLSTSIWKCKDGNIQYLKGIKATDSIAQMYGSATKALGFIPNRHEGKILGLAAYGNPDKLNDIMKKHVKLKNDGTFRLYGLKQMGFFFRHLLKTNKREDIAAVLQRTLEETIVHFAKHYIEITGINKVALSGGAAANVKLNQRVSECEGVEKVFVFPAMADIGTGYGASLLKALELNKVENTPIKTMLLGKSFSDSEIFTALNNSGLKYHKMSDYEDLISSLLVEKKVVGWFDNRMEFGPRALGSRSILASADDPSINKWLNVRLKRTEFMPFAPVTLYEKRHKCYKNIEKSEHSAMFMTITFDCTAEMLRQSPAAVHVDGTARPQLITEEFNKRYYRILKRYYQKTGIPSIINTSFNMHEEPIVATPEDAIRSFKDGKLDYLAIGSYIISYKEAALKEEDPLLYQLNLTTINR